MTLDEQIALEQYIEIQFNKVDEPNLDYMGRSGLLFPNRTPQFWDTFPDEWDDAIEQRGINSMTSTDLESYLSKWNVLLGHAYWVRGIYQSRQEILQRTHTYVADYVFSRASGGREQKAAISGSHPLTAIVLERLTEVNRQLFEIGGLIHRWEQANFIITRTITLRSNRGY